MPASAQTRSLLARRVGLRAIFLALPLVLAYGQSTSDGAVLSAVIPLGADSILLQPAKKQLNMLLAVECKEFANFKLVGNSNNRSVKDLSGNDVRFYPRDLAFRFTIGSRTAAEETSAYPLETKETVDHFQSNLHFRLKVFHGIAVKNYEPAAVKIIGVPVTMPYDERIYHFNFSLPQIPVDDRMMLEVLDDHGNRVTKFHLQLI